LQGLNGSQHVSDSRYGQLSRDDDITLKVSRLLRTFRVNTSFSRKVSCVPTDACSGDAVPATAVFAEDPVRVAVAGSPMDAVSADTFP
jgi:hypothetical protein